MCLEQNMKYRAKEHEIEMDLKECQRLYEYENPVHKRKNGIAADV